MRKSTVILTNMCLIENQVTQEVVVQYRDPARYAWSGYSFPGGHIEVGESLHDAVVREVLEETGLTISNPKLVGIKNWHIEDGIRYLVLCYKATDFTGTLHSTDEGVMSWVKISELDKLDLAYDMSHSFRLMTEDSLSEFYYPEKVDGDWVKQFY